jgi:hypothetical protein
VICCNRRWCCTIYNPGLVSGEASEESVAWLIEDLDSAVPGRDALLLQATFNNRKTQGVSETY